MRFIRIIKRSFPFLKNKENKLKYLSFKKKNSVIMNKYNPLFLSSLKESMKMEKKRYLMDKILSNRLITLFAIHDDTHNLFNKLINKKLLKDFSKRNKILKKKVNNDKKVKTQNKIKSFYKNSPYLSFLYQNHNIEDIYDSINERNISKEKIGNKLNKLRKKYKISKWFKFIRQKKNIHNLYKLNLTYLSKLNKLNKFNSLSEYHLPIINKFINQLMRNGKKSIAEKLVYASFNYISLKKKKNPFLIVKKAIQNSKPLVELKPYRQRGRTLQMPKAINIFRQSFLGMKWILDFSKENKQKDLIKTLSEELFNSAYNKGKIQSKIKNLYKAVKENLVYVRIRYKKKKKIKFRKKKFDYTKTIKVPWYLQKTYNNRYKPLLEKFIPFKKFIKNSSQIYTQILKKKNTQDFLKKIKINLKDLKKNLKKNKSLKLTKLRLTLNKFHLKKIKLTNLKNLNKISLKNLKSKNLYKIKPEKFEISKIISKKSLTKKNKLFNISPIYLKKKKLYHNNFINKDEISLKKFHLIKEKKKINKGKLSKFYLK